MDQHFLKTDENDHLGRQVDSTCNDKLASELLEVYPEAKEFLDLVRKHDGLGQIKISRELHPLLSNMAYQYSEAGPFWTLERESSCFTDHAIISIGLNAEKPSICLTMREGSQGGLSILKEDEARDEIQRNNFGKVMECYKAYFISTAEYLELEQGVQAYKCSLDRVGLKPEQPELLAAVDRLGLGNPGFRSVWVVSGGKAYWVFEKNPGQEDPQRYLEEFDMSALKYTKKLPCNIVPRNCQKNAYKYDWKRDEVFEASKGCFIILDSTQAPQFCKAVLESDTSAYKTATRLALARESGSLKLRLRELKRIAEEDLGSSSNRDFVQYHLGDLLKEEQGSANPIPKTVDELVGLTPEQLSIAPLPAHLKPINLKALPAEALLRWPADF